MGNKQQMSATTANFHAQLPWHAQNKRQTHLLREQTVSWLALNYIGFNLQCECTY